MLDDTKTLLATIASARPIYYPSLQDVVSYRLEYDPDLENDDREALDAAWAMMENCGSQS